MVTTAIQTNKISECHYLLSKHELHKTENFSLDLFINNSRKVKKSGLSTTEEIERRRKYLIKQAQRKVEHSEKFIVNQKRLNLHKNQ